MKRIPPRSKTKVGQFLNFKQRATTAKNDILDTKYAVRYGMLCCVTELTSASTTNRSPT
jgi:hypothetical protein